MTDQERPDDLEAALLAEDGPRAVCPVCCGPTVQTNLGDGKVDTHCEECGWPDARPSSDADGLTDDNRKRFEDFIGKPPYELNIERWPSDESDFAWPGQYVDGDVQVAWEAWNEAQKGATLKCGYCGQDHPKETPPTGPQFAKEQTEVCEKHIIRQLEMDKARLIEAMVGFVQAREKSELIAMKDMISRVRPVTQTNVEVMKSLETLISMLP